MSSEKLLHWRKITKGAHYHNGIAGKQKVEFNGMLKAPLSELSSPINRRQFVCVDDHSVNDPNTDVGSMLAVVPDDDDPTKFNIVNPGTGKKINETPMELEKAEEISGVSYDLPVPEEKKVNKVKKKTKMKPKKKAVSKSK